MPGDWLDDAGGGQGGRRRGRGVKLDLRGELAGLAAWSTREWDGRP